jgi:hypothetical protein
MIAKVGEQVALFLGGNVFDVVMKEGKSRFETEYYTHCTGR